MILTITKVEQAFASNGSEYRKVTGIADGRETTKSVFDNLSEAWPLLEENRTLEFVLQKKGQFWNVIEIKPIQTPPPQEAGVVEKRIPSIIPNVIVKTPSTKTMDDKNRSFALAYAKDLFVARLRADSTAKIEPLEILAVADIFNTWLNGMKVDIVKED